MEKLKGLIKLRLDISENITLRHHGESEDLNSETPISELYNTNESIIIDGKYYIRPKLDYLQ